MSGTFDAKDKRIEELLQASKEVNSANELLRHDLNYITEQLAKFAQSNEVLTTENEGLKKQV